MKVITLKNLKEIEPYTNKMGFKFKIHTEKEIEEEKKKKSKSDT